MVAARTWNKLKRHSVEGSETKQHNATNSTRPNEKKSVEMYLHTLMLRFGFRPTLSCRSPICLSLSLGSLYLCAAGLQRMLLLASSIDPISTARGYCLLHNNMNSTTEDELQDPLLLNSLNVASSAIQLQAFSEDTKFAPDGPARM